VGQGRARGLHVDGQGHLGDLQRQHVHSFKNGSTRAASKSKTSSALPSRGDRGSCRPCDVMVQHRGSTIGGAAGASLERLWRIGRTKFADAPRGTPGALLRGAGQGLSMHDLATRSPTQLIGSAVPIVQPVHRAWVSWFFLDILIVSSDR
jgi:hypothetical protein